MAERYENNNSARVSWTKLESANILFNRRRQGKMRSLLDQSIMHMRATQHFHHGLLLGMTHQKKRNSEKRTEIFLEFLVFRKQAHKKGRAKMRKTIYTGKLPTSKRRTRKSFWVFFLVL